MSKLPQLTAIELIKIIKKIGFEIMRQEGSHIFLRETKMEERQLFPIILERNLIEGC